MKDEIRFNLQNHLRERLQIPYIADPMVDTLFQAQLFEQRRGCRRRQREPRHLRPQREQPLRKPRPLEPSVASDQNAPSRVHRAKRAVKFQVRVQVLGMFGPQWSSSSWFDVRLLRSDESEEHLGYLPYFRNHLVHMSLR